MKTRKEVDDIIESLMKKNTEVLEYCEAYTDQMWAASIVSIILNCDFRDAKQKLNEYFADKD